MVWLLLKDGCMAMAALSEKATGSSGLAALQAVPCRGLDVLPHKKEGRWYPELH